MDSMRAIKVALCAMLLTVAASAFADSATNQLPTIAEIDAEIASLAYRYGAKTLWREFLPTVGRIRKLQDSFLTQEVLQVQWHVVFNSFCELMLHDLSECPEPVRRNLWEEFCRRAGASDPERAEAHSDLYRWYKIVYP